MREVTRTSNERGTFVVMTDAPEWQVYPAEPGATIVENPPYKVLDQKETPYGLWARFEILGIVIECDWILRQQSGDIEG